MRRPSSAGRAHRDPAWLREWGLPRLAAVAAHLDRELDTDFDAGLRVVELGVLSARLGRLEAVAEGADRGDG